LIVKKGMIYLQSVFVGLLTSVLAAVLLLLAVLLPMSGTSSIMASSLLVPVSIVASLGFLLGFSWRLRRAI
jgi:hypothetical protein